MKIAGRKNDGAWYRTNKVIAHLSGDDRASITAAAVEALSAKAGAAYTDITSLAAECGVTLTDLPPNGDQWLTVMFTQGIPRQVWNGRLSFTTYSKVGGKFKANYQTQIHYFAKDLRRFCKYAILGIRAVHDVLNAGTMNPGKLPNANKNS